ncbi:MAG: hypothetical protein EBV06_07640 [Planctomycetia bacterium]|nr:hypothetical protein [Planctomycetia bacterium]
MKRTWNIIANGQASLLLRQGNGSDSEQNHSCTLAHSITILKTDYLSKFTIPIMIVNSIKGQNGRE